MQNNVRDKLIVQQTTNLGTENLQHFISYLLNIMVVLIYLTCYIICALWKDLQEIVSCLTACQSWGMFCKRLTDLTGPKSGFLFLVFHWRSQFWVIWNSNKDISGKKNWLDWCLSEELHYHSVELNLEISHWACKVTLTFKK